MVENADTVDRDPLPGLPCCRVCLHLFPSEYMLFHHVRSTHPNCEASDSVYLEELRAQTHLTCPICSNPPAFLATPTKLRRHLRVSHGIEHYVETCRFCHAEFVDKQELELHMGISHSVRCTSFHSQFKPFSLIIINCLDTKPFNVSSICHFFLDTVGV